jgi:H+-translocating NAD(P) transhydrogenase subunit alpha
VRIAVARETRRDEARVAVVPEVVERYVALGAEVHVEPGAGIPAGFDDEAYAAAGAVLDPQCLEAADLVLAVQPPAPAVVKRIPRGSAVVSFLPTSAADTISELRDRGVDAWAVELLPRISRAQSMDALSSQALVAGYRCAIVAAGLLRRFFPLNMTAAGTVQPAQVLVLGAGVAGLQAIATSKRLGAVVKAYDVRPAAAEEIRSMGAEAITLDLEDLSADGGYAKEMTTDRAERQRELLAPHVAAADALITTAAVPGRPAPLLVTREMVEAMSPGSVVVDLAAESGGNVERSEPGRVIRVGDAQVWGGENVPSQMPDPASRLYAANLLAFVTLMTTDEPEPLAAPVVPSPGAEGDADEAATDSARPAEPPGETVLRFAPDMEDEVVAKSCVVKDGVIVHEMTRAVLQGGSL